MANQWLLLPNLCRAKEEELHRTKSSASIRPGCYTMLMELICKSKRIEKSLLNVFTNELLVVKLPDNARRKTICGFSQSWLILFDNATSSLTLFNPFTSQQINTLPKLPQKGVLVHKAVLSSDPANNPHDYSVLAIYGDERELIGYQVGYMKWTVLQDNGDQYDDVRAPSDEEFQAVNELGRLVCCQAPEFSCFQVTSPWFFTGGKVYLANLGTETYMLLSFSGTKYSFQHETYDDRLKRFEIYRYDEGRWYRTIDWGQWTVFLGDEHLAVAYEAPKFKPNCIYFTDDEGDLDNWGVFSLEDGEAERLQWFMPVSTSTVDVELISDLGLLRHLF